MIFRFVFIGIVLYLPSMFFDAMPGIGLSALPWRLRPTIPAMGDVPAPRSSRLDSIDVLRGLVMVLMALDHTRDFFSKPENLDLTWLQWKPADLYFTRWITHLCAPTFVFLAGAGAYLAGTRMSRGQLAWFLFSRGLWLIFLELTLVFAEWWVRWDFSSLILAVIWTLGASMVLLSALVWLPPKLVGLIGIIVVAMHNLLDGLPLAEWGPAASVLDFLCTARDWHIAVPDSGTLLGTLNERLLDWQGLPHAKIWTLAVPYPVLPWFGVMAIGYALGPLLGSGDAQRRPRLFALGLAAIVGFVALRWSNVYGDPRPWQSHPDPMKSVQDFLHCEKYPPSLCYVLMTLGVSLAILSLLPDRAPAILRPLVVFGRVPLFFYLLHLPLLHVAATLVTYLRQGAITFEYPPSLPGSGFELPGIYIAWLIVVFLLYWPCRWFAGVKRRHPGGLLSYL
jgi:uncharacterized membrane protein